MVDMALVFAVIGVFWSPTATSTVCLILGSSFGLMGLKRAENRQKGTAAIVLSCVGFLVETLVRNRVTIGV